VINALTQKARAMFSGPQLAGFDRVITERAGQSCPRNRVSSYLIFLIVNNGWKLGN
jgi:hypothetical protein